MTQLPNPGPNQTGLESAPQRAVEMLEGRDMFPPLIAGGVEVIAEERIEYARESRATGTGSVPPLYGREEEALTPRMVALVDKLGERIAVERMGARQYDALISKHQAYGSFAGGPSERDLRGIRLQRQQHIASLHEVIEAIGGDSTAVTPSANRAGVVGKGINQVLNDPRTNLLQCLETMVAVEWANLHGWEQLIVIARLNGMNDVAERFESARQDEQEHVRMVTRWVAAAYR